MENASKALIIAAAILISIMIISLGIWIFSMANKAMSGTNLDAITVAQFNQQFTQYEGTRQSGSKLKTLADAVVQSNFNHIDDKSMQVTVWVDNVQKVYEHDSGSGGKYNLKYDRINMKNVLKDGNTYKVEFDYAESGIIKNIKITTNS